MNKRLTSPRDRAHISPQFANVFSSFPLHRRERQLAQTFNHTGLPPNDEAVHELQVIRPFLTRHPRRTSICCGQHQFSLNGDNVSSPFTLTADATTCSSEKVTSITYSLDNGTDLAIAHDTVIDEKVDAGLGTHTVHVKAWGEKGALCVSEVKVTVTDAVAKLQDGTQVASLSIPSNASAITSIQTHSNWEMTHDGNTPGRSSGSMSIVNNPSHDGAARKFETHFSGSGGERYSDSFGEDTTATNFVYDGWVYISSNNLANMELDLNQVLENGDVMIYSFQCSGHSGFWEYGSSDHGGAKWVKSNAACNPKDWATNTWHHVQIAYSRNNSGYITYHSVTFDGTQHNIEKTVYGKFSLHWGHVLQTNFQIDGVGSGSNTTYLDDLTVYRW